MQSNLYSQPSMNTGFNNMNGFPGYGNLSGFSGMNNMAGFNSNPFMFNPFSAQNNATSD